MTVGTIDRSIHCPVPKWSEMFNWLRRRERTLLAEELCTKAALQPLPFALKSSQLPATCIADLPAASSNAGTTCGGDSPINTSSKAKDAWSSWHDSVIGRIGQLAAHQLASLPMVSSFAKGNS